jgi:thiol-disulfide isomerase/thioredoxin
MQTKASTKASAAAIVVVAAVVLALALFHGSGGSPAPSAGGAITGPSGPSLTQLVGQVTGVPAATLDQVGAGQTSARPSSIGGAALTASGKPELLYLGAEFCPYCAAERWAMINALSRFGTFTGLTTKHSSSTDVDPNTPTWTFYGSKYTSNYITFTSVEETTNIPSGNTYTTLQTPTAAQNALGAKYDASGSIPFIDIGNKYAEVGNLQPYGPALLVGKTWAQVAAALSQPTSAIAQAAIGNANYLTAGICEQTGNLPATACTPTIKALEAKFAK